MLQFAALMAAAKPKDRSDQYKVLAALFSLNAHADPVTAKQVRETMVLQLGKKNIPSNISACLRKYSAFVDPAEKGPPIKWSLTEPGVEKLRALSGLQLNTTSKSDNSFGCDVGVVCALEHPELVAFRSAVGASKCWQEVGDGRCAHLYQRAELAISSNQTLNVVCTTATSMGLTAAAIATTQLINQFRPRLVLMVGIAAGTKSGGKRFGDVLVADPSVDYNSGKVSLENGIRAFLPDPYPIGLNPRVRSVLQKYRTEHPIFSKIRSRWGGSTPAEANRLHLGPLGAADQVIDDPSRVIEIQQNWRKLIGVEMETYAVYRACNEAPEPKPRFVSFKSVCDFAAEKTDSWQEFAAFIAAEFAVEFLKSEWNGLWPKETSDGK